MSAITGAQFNNLKTLQQSLDREFETWKPHLEEIAKFFLPRRYAHLSATTASYSGAGMVGGYASGNRLQKSRNTSIIDPYSTVALQSLAAGLLDGITSPARTWFSIDLSAYDKDSNPEPVVVTRWRQEVVRRMFAVLGGSNFYNAMAIKFLDIACFGSSSFIIYEDFDDVIRCYNNPVGEFRFITNNRRVVSGISRTTNFTIRQLEEEFGLENMTLQSQQQYNQGGGSLQNGVKVHHIIEPNKDDAYELGNQFTHREIYWESTSRENKVLRVRGFYEKPDISGRWEILGNDPYGTSPCMVALPKVVELQSVMLEKGKALAYMNKPPVVADSVFKKDPKALLPGGKTYVTQASSFGAKAIYTVQPPINEMRVDIEAIHKDIDALLHNDLFRMISNLSTVRSATEIEARRDEKLVQLAAVLERFENEVLSPCIKRVYGIMSRKGLIPEVPEELQKSEIEISYTSILSDAQRSVGTATIERFLQMVAQTGSVWPDLLEVPDAAELLRNYAERLNVDATGIRPREEVEARRQEKEAAESQQQQAELGATVAQGAQQLGDTDVGGGQNALAALLGN